MDLHGWIALATLAAAAVLFLTKPIPIAVTALAIPVVLVATGVLADPSDALQGFGTPETIAIGSIFVIGGALQESGIASRVGRTLYRLARRSEVALLVLVMLIAAFFSSFMSNAAVVALLLPAVVAISRRALLAPSRLLLPLAYATVLGGTVTLFGSAPNLLVGSHLREALAGGDFPGVSPFGVFDFAAVGLPIVVTGILYMVTIGRRLLPSRHVEDRLREARLPEAVARSYGLAENLFQMRVVEGSGIVGKTVAQVAIRPTYGLTLVMIDRPGALGSRRYLHPHADLVFQPEDRLFLEGEDVAAWAFAETETLQFGLPGPRAIEKLLGRGMTLAEVTIPPRAHAVGQTLRELAFRARYALTVLSLWRRGEAPRKDAADVPLQEGDVVLVSGSTEKVDALGRDPDYIVLTDQSLVEDVGRAPLTVALLLVALVPPVLDWLPISISALAAALLLVVTGCISPAGLRRAIDWKVIALVVGTIPLGQALEETGVASAVADGLLAVAPTVGPVAVIALLFLLSAAAAMLTTNAAAAVIVAPIAARAAALGGMDPRTLLLAVAFGCSCAFLLPSAQWNLIVMAPGGYRWNDYLRVGAGMSVVMAATAIALLAIYGL